MKRAERSTDRNPPPIFTKLATKVEPRRCSYLLFSENPKDAYSPNRKWN